MLNDNMNVRFSYFFNKYSFRQYYSANSPALFFSLWGLGELREHRSFALIIWRGSDVLKMEKKLKYIKNRKNIFHVAISSYIARDLDKYGIKYKFIPIVGVNNKYFKPVEKGNEIYTYVPQDNKKKYYKRYGMDVIKKIQKKCKYKINIFYPNKYNRKKIFNIYKKCFCGLRMTEHDGLPSSVIEMGLMGRKSFYNGNIPGSIQWDSNNIEKIIEGIKKEAQKIRTIDYKYAKEISNFINIDTKWLDTKFWKE